jgi:hypothetical protein
MEEHVGYISNAFNVSIENFRWKTTIEITRFTCEDNIKMDRRDIGCKGVNWIQQVKKGQMVG